MYYAPFTVVEGNNEYKFSHIRDVANYWADSNNQMTIFDAYGVEIPEEDLKDILSW